MTNNAFEPPPTSRPEARSENRTLWVVLGLVAVVAIVALVYVFSQNNAATQQAALDTATAQQQTVDSANSANTSAAQANQAAANATGAAAAARSAPIGADQVGRQEQPANPAPPADNGGQGASTPPPGQ